MLRVWKTGGTYTFDEFLIYPTKTGGQQYMLDSFTATTAHYKLLPQPHYLLGGFRITCNIATHTAAGGIRILVHYLKTAE